MKLKVSGRWLASRCRVLNLLSGDLQRVFGLDDFFFRSGRLLFFFRLFRGLFWSCLRRLLGEAHICAQEKQGGTQKAYWLLHSWRSSLSKLVKYKIVTCGIVCESTDSVNRLEGFATGLLRDFFCAARIHR